MKICILDDADPDDQLYPYAPEYYLTGHTWEKYFLHKETAISQIKEIAAKDFDVVLNLCDGAWDENRPGIEVVQALEKFDMAFTGADQYFYEPTREAMKMVCEVNKLGFPRGIQITKRSEIKEILEHLKFPMLVKHPNSYASVGITPQSKVANEEELRTQVTRNMKLFGGCLVEEFIEGTEYSVLVVENPEDYDKPVVFSPIEVLFAAGETFKHESLKWVDYNKISCREVTDEKLKKELEYMAQKVFTGLKGTGYGRCDIRRDEAGNLYLLEINPNGAVLYPPTDPGTADHILALDKRGHALFVELILKSAVKEQENRQKGWQVKYYPEGGFGLYATRHYNEGDEVLSFEDLPHTLVSSTKVEKMSDEEKAKLYSTSFHLAKSLLYAPSKYPGEWSPVDHSCNPTLWFSPDSWQLVAKRTIKPGDPLTLDYGMLYSDEMPTFKCYCESKNCRHEITGLDYKLPEMTKFAGHRSPYIEGQQ